jgi:hypothetical protein
MGRLETGTCYEVAETKTRWEKKVRYDDDDDDKDHNGVQRRITISKHHSDP